MVPVAKNMLPKKKKAISIGWFLYGELIGPKSTNLFEAKFLIRKAIPKFILGLVMVQCAHLTVHLKNILLT